MTENADHTDNADLQQLKRRLSPRVLRIPGVSGIGTGRGTLTVYLVDDSEAPRRAVEAVVQSEAGNTAVEYVVTGTFRPH
jgi:hypothetical protein